MNILYNILNIMKNQAQFIWFGVSIIFFLLFVYTRSVNLSWGLPYPMHPDERNMAVAVQQLHCDELAECFHPHFFAYGQFPLYLAYGGIFAIKILTGRYGTPISYNEAALALRIISAVASVVTVFFIGALTRIIITDLFPRAKKYFFLLIPVLYALFTPCFIQFAHFGTTESLLMCLYLILVYVSIQMIYGRMVVQSYIVWVGVLSGVALGTKLTGITFLAVPAVTLIHFYISQIGKIKKQILLMEFFSSFFILSILTIFIFFVCSPYTFLAYDEFLGSMRYESDVALGKYIAFYTRQFEHTVPVLFQTIHTLPFVFGLVPFILCLLGFFLLPWKKKDINLLRFALLMYAVPQFMLFAKWTRFLAPFFPLMVVIISVFTIFVFMRYFEKIRYTVIRILLLCIIMVLSLIPGIAYLAVYTSPDVRFQASEWIYQNIPDGSSILSETANVIDIPITRPGDKIETKKYRYTSFNFYDLDANPNLRKQLNQELILADYIFVPSRRIFANHTCLRPEDYTTSVLSHISHFFFSSYYDSVCAYRKAMYPELYTYYRDLFSGELGFEHVATFTSYPRISFGNKVVLTFPDEDAEETWTVFDHPVIRIYKKTVPKENTML